MDREKVVKALECLKEGSYCECCDYKPYDDCIKRVATDALALLKEQEAKEQLSDAVHETAKQFRQTIVRCKDCKHMKVLPCDIHGHIPIYCTNLCIYSEGFDWFCADGIAKDTP